MTSSNKSLETGMTLSSILSPLTRQPDRALDAGQRRQQIAQLAEKCDLIVLEDNPYGEINFTGERIPSIKSYDQSGHVIYTSTFSKILAPGMRVGWLIADEELIPHFTMLKQTVDLHTDNFTQYTIAKFFEQNDVDEHVRQITDLYRSRKDAMIAAMEKYFPA
ncbi:aminotransferase class I/II-fold pyridoxal phosphate-dependent enzyme [Limosilactobacillus fermentum]